ncbi:hypothetical protein NKH77_00795 [Streptomyces sp. M19]
MTPRSGPRSSGRTPRRSPGNWTSTAPHRSTRCCPGSPPGADGARRRRRPTPGATASPGGPSNHPPPRAVRPVAARRTRRARRPPVGRGRGRRCAATGPTWPCWSATARTAPDSPSGCAPSPPTPDPPGCSRCWPWTNGPTPTGRAYRAGCPARWRWSARSATRTSARPCGWPPGAVSVAPSDRLDSPTQTQTWGLGLAAGLELPGRWGGLVDLPATADRRAGQRLAAVLAGIGDEDQLAVRPTGCPYGG